MLPPEGHHPLAPICTVLGRHGASSHTECVTPKKPLAGRFQQNPDGRSPVWFQLKKAL